MALETLVDNLRNGYNQLQPGTMLHADQLMAAQVRDASLRTQSFYVADGPLYSLEGKQKTPTLWLTREPNNLVLHHLNDTVNSSYDQLIDVNNGNYRPNPEEARAAMAAKDTLRIDLTKLRLHGDDVQWRYVEISTSKYAKQLKTEERKFAERFYGQGKKFSTAMATLKEASINTTQVYVLNPDYVRQEAHESSIGRAAWRGSFHYDASSFALGHYVGNRYGLRGVRLGEARSAAPEKLEAPAVPLAAPEMKAPSMEEILAVSQQYVPQSEREKFQQELRALYKL